MVIDNRYSHYCCPHKTGGYSSLSAVCFSRGYYPENVYNKYIHETLFIYNKKCNKSNFCFLSSDETFSYILEVCKLLGCKVLSFTDGKECLKVQIAIPEDRRYFLFVNTIIRYCYEFPFASLCYCAFKHRHLFPKLNIIQIVQLYIGALNVDCYNHALLRAGYVFSNANIKSYFNIMKRHFNGSANCLVTISDENVYFIRSFNIFNTKTIPYISKLISDKVKRIYDAYEKDICYWQ